MAREPESITKLRELWRVVLHRKWIVLLAGCLLSATAIIEICLLPDWYSSSITIWVDPQKIPSVPDTVTMDQLRFDTLNQQVMSLTRLEATIDELHLYPELLSCMSRESVVDYMRKHIVISMRPGGDRNPSVFTITYTGKDPKVVAKVATKLAESFIDWDLAAREHQATNTVDFVTAELQEAKTSLDQAEAKVRAYKVQYLNALPEQVPGKLTHLQMSLQANMDQFNRLDQEKIMLTQAPTSVRYGAPTERTQLLDQEQKLTAELTELRSRYSEEYPDIQVAQDRLASVRKQIAKLPPAAEEPVNTPGGARLMIINREMARLQEEQKSLTAQINEYQAKAEEGPLHEQQLAELNAEYQSARSHYQSLQERQFSAGMATDLQHSREAQRFSVLEPARIPDAPIRPRRKLMVGLMVPFCFLFSLGSVLLLDLSRGKITNERELRTLLPAAVPVLGRIPQIATTVNIRRQRVWAGVAISACLLSCFAVALVMWRVHPHF